MVHQKKLYKSRLAFIYFIVVVLLFLSGCSSTPQFITVTETDTILIHDTVHLRDIDSIWYGGIYNGKDSIGSIAVSPKSKTAIVDIKWLKPDSVLIPITDTKYLMFSSIIERVLATMFTVMPLYQKLILIIMLIGALIVIYKLWKK